MMPAVRWMMYSFRKPPRALLACAAILLCAWLAATQGSKKDGFFVALTGDSMGFMEQCGCDAGQVGGLEPRAGVLQNIRDKGDPVLLLDCGNIMETTGAEGRLAALTYIEAMNLMGYQGVVLASQELNMHPTAFLDEIARKADFPFLAANLERTDGRPQCWKPWTTVLIGSRRVGIIGLVSEGFPINPGRPYRRFPFVKALDQWVPIVKKNCDLVVVLTSNGYGIIGNYVPIYSDVNIWLGIDRSSNSIPYPDSRFALFCRPYAQELLIHQLSVSDDGRRWKVNSGSGQLEVDKFHHQGTRDLVGNFYQEVKKRDIFKPVSGPLSSLKAESADSAIYVGDNACAACHEKIYKQWKKTRHASAMNTLLNAQRHYVPNCLSCHVTGYGHASGFQEFPGEEDMSNVGCETCHGPGEAHILDSKAGSIRNDISPANPQVCLKCHNIERDSQFKREVKNRFRKIVHYSPKSGATTP
jgi:Cytochrome c554 and c-prime